MLRIFFAVADPSAGPDVENTGRVHAPACPIAEHFRVPKMCPLLGRKCHPAFAASLSAARASGRPWPGQGSVGSRYDTTSTLPLDKWRRAEPPPVAPVLRDRKSVVEGKRVSVRVDLGGRRIHKKN